MWPWQVVEGVCDPGGQGHRRGYFAGGETVGRRTVLGAFLVLVSVITITTTPRKSETNKHADHFSVGQRRVFGGVAARCQRQGAENSGDAIKAGGPPRRGGCRRHKKRHPSAMRHPSPNARVTLLVASRTTPLGWATHWFFERALAHFMTYTARALNDDLLCFTHATTT